MGRHPDRNAQFENVARLKAEYLGAGLPVLSIDTKKKELLGVLSGRSDRRSGGDRDQRPRLREPGRGQGDPTRVVRRGGRRGLCASEHQPRHQRTGVRQHRRVVGATRPGAIPRATKLLVLCDGGGSNSATQYLFKDSSELSNRLALEIRIAHYPPYCSKYNPIEHRLFRM